MPSFQRLCSTTSLCVEVALIGSVRYIKKVNSLLYSGGHNQVMHPKPFSARSTDIQIIAFIAKCQLEIASAVLLDKH